MDLGMIGLLYWHQMKLVLESMSCPVRRMGDLLIVGYSHQVNHVSFSLTYGDRPGPSCSPAGSGPGGCSLLRNFYFVLKINFYVIVGGLSF